MSSDSATQPQQQKKSLDANAAFQLANTCAVDEDYESAIGYYGEAIRLSDEGKDRATYFEKRAQCQIKMRNFNAALEDANEAIKNDQQNANAHLRKGVALFELDRFREAKQAFEKCAEIDPSNTRCKTWIRKCNAEMKEEEESNGASSKEEATIMKDKKEVEQGEEVNKTIGIHANSTTASSKIKHNFYQINDQVVLSILGLRNVAADARHIEIGEETVSVSIALPDGDTWEKVFELLHPIDSAKSSFKHLSVKTEIVLIKKDPTIEWAVLEKLEADKIQSKDPKRFYPSSKGDKDWDGLEKEVISQVEEEKPEGDAALNELFKSIYANASEDARRAMIKSFTESGGTVLSTNWEEVSKKRVEATPPDGMEARAWNN